VTLFVAGLNHKTASVDVRESLAVEQHKLGDVLRDVQVLGVATELVILSTCNRVELYGVAEAPGLARAAAFRELARFRGVDAAAVEPVLYTHVDGDAVRHVFRVAASLDSMVLGEPQIVGQVKDAFALAQTAQTVGPALHALFSQVSLLKTRPTRLTCILPTDSLSRGP
jgi:glutamyl-tRNA reductase